MPTTKTPLRLTLTRVSVAVLALLMVWLIGATQLFHNVNASKPEDADAVVMLGGASKERLLEAMMLRAELDAPYLVLSNTDTPGNASADEYCHTHSNKAIYPDVICFTPNPMNTRGEADAVGLIATKYGWKSLAVVTSKYHIARSERLLNQCVPSKIQMVATDPELSLTQWLRRFIIESGGLLTVFLGSECDSPIR
ncbi:YdcF family protein [Arthrobacter psychrolactophilus]